MVLPVLARAFAAAGVALAGVLFWAEPAQADVSVSPDRGGRGDPASLTLRVTDDRPGVHTTRIEVRIPERSPVGEVFPMSVDGWGPSIATRRVDRALPGLHRPAVTEVVSAITWVRTDPPGQDRVIELRISLGPLPDADRLTLPVVQTYSDGSVVTWADPAGGRHPAPAIALTPGRPGGHGGTTAHDAASPGEPAGAAGSAVDDPPAGLGLTGQIGVALAGGLAAGAGLGAGYLLLGRRRTATLDGPTADAGPDATPDPVTGGTAGTWRLRE